MRAKTQVIDDQVQNFSQYEKDWEILHPIMDKIVKMADSMFIVANTCVWTQLDGYKDEMSETVDKINKSIKEVKKDHAKNMSKTQNELAKIRKTAVLLQKEVNLLNSESSAANAIQIGHAIKRSLEQYNVQLNKRFKQIAEEIDNIREPISKQMNNVKAEKEGMARQSQHFMSLYRQCVTDFKTEVEAKQRLLENGNEFGMQPGLLNSQLSSAIG